MTFRKNITRLLRWNGKTNFIYKLNEHSSILDVGCGNASTILDIKSLKPRSKLTGIDIDDYKQTAESKKLIDNYVISQPRHFARAIEDIPGKFDVVMSSHNLEHTLDRDKVLINMLSKVEKNGLFYLSFPCMESTKFPSRQGTLNYFDDETHHDIPPSYDDTIRVIQEHGFKITYSTRRHRPMLLFFIGLILEPISKLKKKVLRGTWEYYGFESIIHAKKI